LTLDPSVRPATSLPAGDNPWAADPAWDWTTVPAADGVAFQTAPFKSDTTFVGPATAYLWVRSASPAVDEEYVTSGFLRSSNQEDLASSTELVTYPSYLGRQARNLSPTSYRLVRVPIDPIGHTFRAGIE
jgi:hypothetical protein